MILETKTSKFYYVRTSSKIISKQNIAPLGDWLPTLYHCCRNAAIRVRLPISWAYSKIYIPPLRGKRDHPQKPEFYCLSYNLRVARAHVWRLARRRGQLIPIRVAAGSRQFPLKAAGEMPYSSHTIITCSKATQDYRWYFSPPAFDLLTWHGNIPCHWTV